MLLLVDLDGVVYRGAEPVAGMPELLARRADRGDVIVYVTNNSRWHHSEYVARLAGMGAPVSADRVVSSARGTALALASSIRPPRLTMVLGGPGLVRELREVGLRTVAASAHGLATGPDALCVGVDFRLDYERLSVAADVVRRGAYFAVTNRDPVLPVADGLRAGAGAIVAAVVVAAGRDPDIVIGKPEPGLLRSAAAVVDRPVDEAIVIGDGLLTDIPAAHAVGARSVLMLTGVSDAAAAAALPPEQRPTHVAEDARGLDAILARLDA